MIKDTLRLIRLIYNETMMKKTICILLLLLVTVSCSAQTNTEDISDEKETVENGQIEEKNNEPEPVVKVENYDGSFILIAAKVVDIRQNPDASGEDNIIGKAYMGETYPVFEKNDDGSYVWYRIGEEKWIASDETWCVESGVKENIDFPYILSEEERKEFISSIDKGPYCYSADISKDPLIDVYMNFFVETIDFPNCNIVYNLDLMKGMEKVYKYNISNIVRIGSDTYDLYVVPVDNNGFNDYSTGILRITDIREEYTENHGGDTYFCLDMTFIKNINDVTSDILEKLYDEKVSYLVSHQVAF